MLKMVYVVWYFLLTINIAYIFWVVNDSPSGAVLVLVSYILLPIAIRGRE